MKDNNLRQYCGDIHLLNSLSCGPTGAGKLIKKQVI